MRIPCAPINTFSEALNDEQVRFREMVVEIGEFAGKPVAGPGCPLKFSRTGALRYRPAPAPGADSRKVLQVLLGLSDTDIEALATTELIVGDA